MALARAIDQMQMHVAHLPATPALGRSQCSPKQIRAEARCAPTTFHLGISPPAEFFQQAPNIRAQDFAVICAGVQPLAYPPAHAVCAHPLPDRWPTPTSTPVHDHQRSQLCDWAPRQIAQAQWPSMRHLPKLQRSSPQEKQSARNVLLQLPHL